ncbi:MAG: hypothetical protein LBB47_06060 [Spirochaetaceae bacterium]|jgi:hypothetical protein|nr:hypothetical protein [Spirochaetaceae bacterium]
MRKKLGLFWFAAALLGAALIFSGCETEADTETITVTKGLAVDVPSLQKLLDTEGVNYVEFVGNLEIGGTDSLVIPAGKTVKVDGGVTVASGGVLAVVGTLNLPEAGTITNSGVVIGSQAFLDSTVVGGLKALPVNDLPTEEEAAGIVGGITAVKDLTLGAADQIPAGLKVYVYGTLTVTSTSAAPTNMGAKVYAIGYVVIEDTVTALAANTTVDVSGAILNSTGNVTVTLPASATLRGIDTGEAKLTIGGAETSLTIGDLNGNVALPSTLGVVRVSGGTGKVTTAAAAITGGAASFGNTGDISFTSTSAITITPAARFAGATSFGGAVTFSATADFIRAASFTGNASFGAAASISGDATFGGTATFDTTAYFAGTVVFVEDVTLTAGTATFRNTAFFANGKKITLTAATSIITLGRYAGLAVGTPADDVPDVYNTVIRNSGDDDVTLIPAENTVLTFATGKGITQSASTTNAHGITISGGDAALIPGSTYTVASASGAVGTLTITDGATLTLAAGVLGTEDPDGDLAATESGLVLTGAASTNGATLTATGGLIAGATTITGDWQAVGSGAVTIASSCTSASSITGIAFTAVANGSGVITQAAVEGNNLTIGEDTEIALGGTEAAAGGAIVLKGATSDGAKLTLAADTAKIVGESGLTDDATLLETLNLAFGSDITGKTTTSDKNLGEFIGATGDDNTIIANTADDVTIDSELVISS